MQALRSSQWYLSHYLVEPWSARAACIQVPYLPWTKDKRPSANARLAMSRVCAQCPVLGQCARYALTGANGDGVEGGFYAGVWVPWNSYYVRPDERDDRAIAQDELRLVASTS